MLELDADDSSDEEDNKEKRKNYDLTDQFQQFKDYPKIPPYIKEIDPEGYSFLTYAFGTQVLYSPEVDDAYYKSKKFLGKTSINVSEDKLKEWLLKTVEKTLKRILLLPHQQRLTDQLASDFFTQQTEFINQEILNWIKKSLRIFFKQTHFTDALPEMEDCLSNLQTKLADHIKTLDLKDIFEPAPFFIVDDFRSNITTHIEKYYRQKGFIQPNNRFPSNTNWPQVKSNNSVEKLMIQEAAKYNGNNTISSLTTLTKQTIFNALLEEELKRDINSVIEKAEGKYRLKQNVTDNLLQASTIGFLFNDKAKEKYLPYNNQAAVEQLTNDIENSFVATFNDELKENKKQMKIKLIRGTLPQQQMFPANTLSEFQSNIRLNMRDKRRKIRQARDDEERQEITGETFQAAWQLPSQPHLALETQEITSQGARNDLVTNLETYGKINQELANFKQNINHEIQNLPKINESLICDWIRDIFTKGEPSHGRLIPNVGMIMFNKIPERFQKPFLKFLVNLTYLLFGCEIQRNPSSLIIHQMMLDLISNGQLTWTNAIDHADFKNNCGGGEMPMSMGSYEKGRTTEGKKIKGSAQPVACARTLHKYHGLFAISPWRYDGGPASESPNNEEYKHVRELVKRENSIVKKWLALKQVQDKPIEDQIKTIEASIPIWYPRKIK